jgi:eukaryotic-like serine/threonine-protein kinase
MNDDRRVKRDDKFGGAGGVRAPLPGESSSSNIPAPIPAPGSQEFYDQTILNIPAADIRSAAAGTLFGQTSQAGDQWRDTQPVAEELSPGTILANRYEILQIVGIGGMGAVYKARDIEIGRLVAFKVIRPEFARDRAIIDRFKQELLLASQVTHKNVIRIFDLGEADGMKFITMEYIHGPDIHSLLRKKGKFSPSEAVDMVRQICRALEAAHSVGVIHRDLKPQNVLREDSGRILVMDFGLARTLEDNGMTQSGSLVGTMDYMSPEQALGQTLDQRSDIFALGIIFYELLSGQMPFQGASAVARLIARTQHPVEPLSTIDPAIPQPLCDIVCRCLERDVNLRYQHAHEVLADLDAFEGGAPVTRIQPAPSLLAIKPAKRKLPWKIVVPAAAVLVIALAGVGIGTGVFTGRSGVRAQAGPVLSLAIFPLRNASGDSSLDWMSSSLADMLSTAVGQSARLHTVSPERLRQVYSDLRLTPSSTLDDAMLKRVANLTTAETVVSGQYVKLGDQINIEVVLQDLSNNNTTTLKAQSTEKDLPSAISTLADSVRKSLSLSSADIKAAKSRSFQVTSSSTAALRDYNAALVLARSGQNLEATRLLTTATQEDPQFGLAFALLSQTQSELGFQAEAVQSSRRAVELSEAPKFPAVIKDLIGANHARVTQDNKKAIDAYEVLNRNLPGDTDIQYALASLYIDTSAYDKARALTTAILKDDPRNVRALWQMGVIEITSNNPQAALDPLTQALSLTIQSNNLEMKALVELAVGISYRLLNKPDDALRNYQDSVAIDEKLGQKRGVAAALDEMAVVQSSSGNIDGALASYKKALELLREIGMNKEVGDTLMDMGGVLSDRGQPDQALQAYQEALRTEREIGDENFEALCLNNIASVYLARGDTGNAFTYFQQALQLREKLAVPGFIAETLSGMGDADTREGHYDEAIKVLIRALDSARKADDQRSAALISSQIGQVFANEGRFGAAVKSMQDAVKGLHTLGDKSKDALDVQNGLANAFARAGNEVEATSALEGAEAAAKELKSDDMLAKILNTRGDIDLYRGNAKDAGQEYQKALQLVGHSKDFGLVAGTRLNLARVALATGHAREAVTALTPLVEKRSTLDSVLAIRTSTTLSEALIQTQALPRARQALLNDLSQAEKAGMKPEIAQIYYLLHGVALAGNSPGDAQNYCRQAVKNYDAVHTEQGGDSFTQRDDIHRNYQACSQALLASAKR